MSEFKDLVMEALLGDEPYKPDSGRAELEQSVRRFEQRERTSRHMAWFAITFGTAVLAFGVWGLWHADEATSLKPLLIYALLIFAGGTQIAFMKQWLFRVQDHYSMMKEIKATQLLLIELSDTPPSGGLSR